MIRLESGDASYLSSDYRSMAHLLSCSGSDGRSLDELVELYAKVPFDELVELYAKGEWWDKEDEPSVMAFNQLVRDGTMPYPVISHHDGVGRLLLPDGFTYTNIPQSVSEAVNLTARRYPRVDIGRMPALSRESKDEVVSKVRGYYKWVNRLETAHRTIRRGAWAHARLSNRDGEVAVAWDGYCGFVLQRSSHPAILFGECVPADAQSSNFFNDIIEEMMGKLVIEDYLTLQHPDMLRRSRKTRVVRLLGNVIPLPENGGHEVHGEQVLVFGFTRAEAIIESLRFRLEVARW